MDCLIRKRLAVLILIVTLLVSFAACAGKGGKKSTSASDDVNGAQSTGVADPLGKYEPAIEITSAIAVGADCIFPEGDDINNNTWTRHYKSDLGIKLTFEWTADTSQYDQKLNLVIASNDMPDYFIAGPEQLKMLSENSQIWDMGPIYERWASEYTKECLEQDPISFKSAHVEGKLMSLPVVDNSIASASLLWIRNDWLNNLNLQMPANMDELIEVARAFTTRDPDQNGKDDTLGIGISRELWGPFASLNGFFNSYHSYVGNSSFWMMNEDGQIVSGNIQPETRTALLALKRMFDEGLIDKEFGVKDSSKVAEDIASGRIGIQYGAWWNPAWPLNACREKDPNADWVAWNILSSDDKEALEAYSNAVYQYIVVDKNYKNPEAVVKMMNYWWNIMKNPSMENYQNYIFNVSNPASGQVYYKYINVLGWEPNGNKDSYQKIQDSLKTGNTKNLTLEEMEFVKQIILYNKGGDTASWIVNAQRGPMGSARCLNAIIDGKGLCNIFYGVSTTVMAEKMPALTKMQNEVFTNIILGDPIEKFDKFVEDWKKMGGDEITREVNEWYKKNY